MFELFEKTKKTVGAYGKFLNENGIKEIKRWEDIPILTKDNYLLKYPLKDLVKDDISKAFLIGTSSGFSKKGSVFWLKESLDEKEYLKKVKALLVDNYDIDKKKTLIIVSLAFGTWIGGMQLASTLRSLASSLENVTIATPGLDISEAVEIAKEFGDFYEKILWIVNPSSINIIYSLVKNEKNLINGKIVFPVVGEYFSENFREEIALKFGYEKEYPYIVKTGYGSADTGDIGMETKETIELRKFFNNNPKVCEEIFAQTEAPMMFSKSSHAFTETIDRELVITKDQFIPLLRYNTKDLGGVINRDTLKNYIDKKLFDSLDEEILYVFGRASEAVVFYGTNLDTNRIGNFLSSLKDMSYAGLFDIKEMSKDDLSVFVFTIYLDEIRDEYAKMYLEALLGFLKSSSNEFRAKYDKLSMAASEELIKVDLKLIKNLKIDKKHRYIRRDDV